MPRMTVTTLAVSFVLLVSCTGSARPARAAEQPVSHRVIAQDKNRIAIVNATGAVEWEVPCAFTSHDISVLPNGNLLLHTGPTTVVEMTPDKKTVWQYVAQPK